MTDELVNPEAFLNLLLYYMYEVFWLHSFRIRPDSIIWVLWYSYFGTNLDPAFGEGREAHEWSMRDFGSKGTKGRKAASGWRSWPSIRRQPQRLPCSYSFFFGSRTAAGVSLRRALSAIAFNLCSAKFGRHCAVSSTRARCLRLHRRAKVPP
eukprot:1734736-Pleurochrysis_carterae.AAC.1